MGEIFMIWGKPTDNKKANQDIISEKEVNTLLKSVETLQSKPSNQIKNIDAKTLAMGFIIHADVFRRMAGGLSPEILEQYKEIYGNHVVHLLKNGDNKARETLIQAIGRIIRQDIHQGWPVYDKICKGNLALSWLRKALTESTNNKELQEELAFELITTITSATPLLSFDARGESAQLLLEIIEKNPELQRGLVLKIKNGIKKLENERAKLAERMQQVAGYFIHEQWQKARGVNDDFTSRYLHKQKYLTTMQTGQKEVMIGALNSKAAAAMRRDTTIDPMPESPFLTYASPMELPERNSHLVWQAATTLAQQQAFVDSCRILNRIDELLDTTLQERLDEIAQIKQGYLTHPKAEELIMRENPASLFRTVLDNVIHPHLVVTTDGYRSYTVADISKMISEPFLSGSHADYARLATEAWGHSALGFQDASFLGMESKANFVPHGEDAPVMCRVGKAAVWGKGLVASLNAGIFVAKRNYLGSWFTDIRIHDHLHSARGGALGRLGVTPFFIVVDQPDRPFPPVAGYYEMADFVKQDCNLPAGRRFGEIPGFYSLRVIPDTKKLDAKVLL